MEHFYRELKVLMANKGNNNNFLSDQQYEKLVEDVLHLRNLKVKKGPRDFWLQKRSVNNSVSNYCNIKKHNI